MGAVQLRGLGELLQDDRGRAHGQSTADHDGGEPGKPRQPSDHGEYGSRGGNLCRPQAEHLAPHRDHARQRELQAEGEQEEDDPELREQPRRLGVRHDAEGMRPQGQADDQVAHGRREAEPASHADDEYGAGQKYENLRQRLDHRQNSHFRNRRKRNLDRRGRGKQCQLRQVGGGPRRYRANPAGSSMPARSNGSGIGGCACTETGTTPAQHDSSWSSASSSGGPVRILAEASVIARHSTDVAFSS